MPHQRFKCYSDLNSSRFRVDNFCEENEILREEIENCRSIVLENASQKYSNPEDVADFFVSEILELGLEKLLLDGSLIVSKASTADINNGYIIDEFRSHSNSLTQKIIEVEKSSQQNTHLTRLAAGFEEDKNIALNLYEKAATQGCVVSQYCIGGHYFKLTDEEKDFTKVAENFKAAADKGYDRAQFNLGICYLKGDGVEKDRAKGIRYIELAADQGNANALNNLAFLCKKGKLVDVNPKEAMSFYAKAADKGSITAQINLADILKEEGDLSAATLNYARAANQNKKYISRLEPSQQGLKILPYNGANTSLNGVEILEVINALRKTIKRKSDRNDSMISDLVTVSSTNLDLLDLATILREQREMNPSQDRENILDEMSIKLYGFGIDASVTHLKGDTFGLKISNADDCESIFRLCVGLKPNSEPIIEALESIKGVKVEREGSLPSRNKFKISVSERPELSPQLRGQATGISEVEMVGRI